MLNTKRFPGLSKITGILMMADGILLLIFMAVVMYLAKTSGVNVPGGLVALAVVTIPAVMTMGVFRLKRSKARMQPT